MSDQISVATVEYLRLLRDMEKDIRAHVAEDVIVEENVTGTIVRFHGDRGAVVVFSVNGKRYGISLDELRSAVPAYHGKDNLNVALGVIRNTIAEVLAGPALQESVTP